ncbi:MAG: hypothetical protein EB021_12545, partial [Gammaproteobacteria bacterium]|nr:hypothetical protein [Gammaproteobacteria bacterium]
MTIRKITAAAIIAAATGAACLANAQTSSTSELEQLKAQLAMLQERLAALEAAQTAQAATTTELQDSIDRTSDNLARTVGEGASSGWLGRWVWKGDLRVRNENIDQEATLTDRNRNRFRLRVGAFARVNDTTRVELQLTT